VLLRAELGLDPGPELTGLQEQILRHDDALAAPAAPEPVSHTCPYMGLVAYDVENADGFFGRTADVDACVRRLADNGVVAVVGPSGAGKSSLVRAGIAAHMRRDGADVVVLTPGVRPLDPLTAVPSTGPAPVLVVDQCEEVVALCDDAAQREAFLQALADHAERAPLVVALRADWLGELTSNAAYVRIVERGLYLLPPIGTTDLRAAIEGPAAQAGLLVEPGLVDLLVREVEHEPGALPLLSHALRTTWERREGRTLTVAGYTAAGGIRGAVAQTAEAVYNSVSPGRRPLLRDLLLRMVSQVDDGAPVRARLSRTMIADDADHTQLVELLVAERLVTSDGDSIELAHEAVTRAWPRLQAWLTDDVIGQRILRHLALAAETWERMGRPDSELYRGVRLAQAVEWRDRGAPRLTPVEQAYLDAAADRSAVERREAEQRAVRQAQTNRRLRILLAGVAVLTIVAVIAGGFAARQAQRASDAAVAADARRVGAQALAADDLDTALLLAVEGVRLDDSPDTRANLLATLGRSPQLIEVIRGEGDGEFGNVGISPDGATIAVYDDANRLWFYDTDTRQARATIQGDPPADQEPMTGAIAFHPDDGPVAASFYAATFPRPVVLLDPVTFQEHEQQLDGFPLGGYMVPWDTVYSPDGTLLAVAFDQYGDSGIVQRSHVVVWDIDAPDKPRKVLDVPRFTHGLAFSPDSRQLYTGVDTTLQLSDVDSRISVHDLDTGQVHRTLPLPGYPFALSPDGKTIAAAADDGATGNDLIITDAATGRQTDRLRGHTEDVLDIAFSPDGTQIASSSADRSIILWDTATGAQRQRLRGHASSVPGIAFDPTSDTLISAGADRLLLRWDRTGERQFAPLRTSADTPHTALPFSVVNSAAAVSPGGAAAVFMHGKPNDYGTAQTVLQVLDIGQGRLSQAVDTKHGRLAAVSWHPEGRSFVTVGPDAFVRVWDARHARVVMERPSFVRGLGVAHLGFGEQIVVLGPDGAVERLDADSLQRVGAPFVIPSFKTSSAAEEAVTQGGGHRFNFRTAGWFASSDGRTVAGLSEVNGRQDDSVTSSDVTVVEDELVLVDVIDGQVRNRVELGLDAREAAFSPDGERIAVTGVRGQVAMVDVATGSLVRRPTLGHDGKVVSISYAADGEMLATGGEDGRVSLWHGRTGALLSGLTVGRPGTAAYVGFEPDGRTVSVATWDGDVYQLDTRVERWVEFACDVAGRNLTQAEWRDAFGDRPYRETCS
jgi:WD40 repeat protein